jgi:hypothetical protein
MKNIPFRPAILSLLISLGLIAGLRVLEAATAAPDSDEAKPMPALVEPPPLDPKIMEMMKTNVMGRIEARIYFVEKWEIAPIQKAQALFAMMAKAGSEDQRKLAHAAVPFVANTNYLLIRQHLLDLKLPRAVLSVLMTDTLKRQYNLKLPALLTLAQRDAHPLQAEAQQLLRGYLGKDHGTDWAQWERTMLTWLKNNPR